MTGVSGSGKTTMILESLIPALEAFIKEEKLPELPVRIAAVFGMRKMQV